MDLGILLVRLSQLVNLCNIVGPIFAKIIEGFGGKRAEGFLLKI